MSKRIHILGDACNMIGGLIRVLGWLLRFARLMLVSKSERLVDGSQRSMHLAATDNAIASDHAGRGPRRGGHAGRLPLLCPPHTSTSPTPAPPRRRTQRSAPQRRRETAAACRDCQSFCPWAGDPKAKDEDGTPPLQEAVRNLRPETEGLVRGLIEAGAETDIFTASALGMCDRVRTLLRDEAGLVDATDAYDATPLHWAARTGKTEAVKLLLESKAKPEARDKHGRTPMEFAVRGGFSEIVGLLVDAGVDVNSNVMLSGWASSRPHALASGTTSCIEQSVELRAECGGVRSVFRPPVSVPKTCPVVSGFGVLVVGSEVGLVRVTMT